MASKAYEDAQIAAHVNELAQRIHSESDARTLVQEIAKLVDDSVSEALTGTAIGDHLARAEYYSVRDPAKSIPEERMVKVWNEYVREIGAPPEAVATVAELHNYRDAMWIISRIRTQRYPSIWTIAGFYAVQSDGKLAVGCRAIEAACLLSNLSNCFENLSTARDRVSKNILISQRLSVPPEECRVGQQAVLRPQPAGSRACLMSMAARSYIQKHGEQRYRKLLERLFYTLFP